jgi:oligosaccharide repeat unit polymerase
VANNFWNLDYALNRHLQKEAHPTTYGFSSVQGFLDMTPSLGGMLGGQIRSDTQMDSQFNKSSAKLRGWNTVMYQWTLYKDFGLAGVFVGPFLIGIALGFLYMAVRRRPSPLNLAAYSFLAFFIYNSIFGFFSESPTYASGFAYVCVCCFLSQTIVARVNPGVGDVLPSTLEDGTVSA